ncbi:MAG: glycosyltransferase family 4 protein, partial [Coriobacteriia bacterium]|nr:glycosyltransferase family 4 protein [Coriobacteriia bacterium]
LVVTVSADSAAALAEHVPGVTPRVVPNGIDVAAFAEEPPRSPYDDPHPLVLYLGWIAEYKGVRDLAEAMPLVREALPDAVLALAGPEIDMTAEDAVASLSPDAYRILGTLDTEEVCAWLHAADVLVLPSRVREGQPRVLLEAMAADTPIVATNVGGVGELLEGGRLGKLVAPGNPAALAAAIVDTLKDSPATTTRLTAAAEAVRAYDSRSVAAVVATAYRDAIATHHPTTKARP